MRGNKQGDIAICVSVCVITVHFPDPYSRARNTFPQLLEYLLLAAKTQMWSHSGNYPWELPSTEGSSLIPGLLTLPQSSLNTMTEKHGTFLLAGYKMAPKATPALGSHVFSLPSVQSCLAQPSNRTWHSCDSLILHDHKASKQKSWNSNPNLFDSEF